MRYGRRHSARVMEYIKTNAEMPRRVRKERARILRFAKRKGIIK